MDQLTTKEATQTQVKPSSYDPWEHLEYNERETYPWDALPKHVFWNPISVEDAFPGNPHQRPLPGPFITSVQDYVRVAPWNGLKLYSRSQN